MNRYIIFAVAGGIGLSLLGLHWYLGVIAGLVAAILVTPPTMTKRVIIEDVTTGKIEIQPNDRATQRYIAGRGE